MTAEQFEKLLIEADAENIATAGLAGMLRPEAVPVVVVENCLRHPGMIASLRRFGLDDMRIAYAMLDPHDFADEVLADSRSLSHPSG